MNHCAYCGEPIVESWATNDDGTNVYVHSDTGHDACADNDNYSATPAGEA